MVKRIKKLIFQNKHLLALCFVIIAFFIPYIAFPAYFSEKDNDLGRTYIPVFSFFKSSVLTYKQIPLWRSDQMMGEPTVSNPLYQYFYPVNLVFLVLPITYGIVIFLLIHFLIAAISTYTFGRFLGFSKNSSVAAGIFYALSVKVLMHFTAGHVTMIAAFSFFPLMVLGFSNLLKKLSYKWLVITAVSAAFMYVNYPTVFYYSFLFLVILTVYRFFQNLKTGNFTKLLKPYLFVSLLVLVIWLGLSAISILPQSEFAPLSTRGDLKIADVAMPVWNLQRFTQSLVFPYLILGDLDHESLLYLGIVPMLLVGVAFLKLKKTQRIFLLFMGFITLLFVLNISTPLFPLLYEKLPLLKYSRVTTRLWFVVAFISAILSAYALNSIRKPKLTIVFLILFIAESSFITYSKIIAIPNLNFKNNNIYSFFKNDRDMYRVYCATYCFNPQKLEVNHVQILNGETPIQQREFVQFLSLAGGYKQEQFSVIFPPYQAWQVVKKPQPLANILGQANVKYVVSGYEIVDQNFVPISKLDQLYLYQNKLFQKRARFENSNEPLEISYSSPNVIALKFEPKNYSRQIIYSENYYPGWVVYNNNSVKPADVYEKVFRTFTVGAQTKEAYLKFEPKSFMLGRAITFATICILLLAYPKYRTKRK